MSLDPHALPLRPRLRGRLHQIAFFVALPAGIALVLLARGATARAAVLVYALSLAGLYGASAAYHRRQWTAKARARMQRLDHSMIFVLIAGTYTPFCLLALHGAWSIVLLAAVWAGAIAGIVLKLVGVDRTKVAAAILYVALGWLAVVATPVVVTSLSAVPLILLAVGGLLYTIGAIVFSTRRPNPSPRVFGYHEVWHSFVVGGSACHYAVILLLARAA
jgi:hemolysin III